MIAIRLVAFAAIAAVAPDPKLTWNHLERASPAELARLIPDAQASEGKWIEERTTRIPGVAEWRGINVELATAPLPTGWSGLCAFDTVSGYFVPTRDNSDELVLDSQNRAPRYRLAAHAVAFVQDRADAPTGCTGPTLSGPRAKDLSVTVGEAPATLGQAAFAIRTVAAALQRAARCASEDSLLCRGIALRSLDLAQMYRLDLSPCQKAKRRWCVRGQWDRPSGDGPVFVDADTAIPVDADLDAAKPHAARVKLSTYRWPVT